MVAIKDALHFCPTEGWFGDPMPMYHDGVYHVYYTKLHPLGRLCWGHISTTDLVHYTEHPDPFPYLADGCPINTGCVIFAEGVFHAYYAGETTDGKMCMYHSTSQDGILFQVPGEVCLVQPDQWYRKDGTWRDPSVMYDEEAGVYRMVFCVKSEKRETPNCFAGMIARAVSKDLVHWDCVPPYQLTGIATTMECPEIFKVDDRWALLYYWHETCYRTADSLDGPWEKGNLISPDHLGYMAARQLFDGKRHITFAWLPRRKCDCSHTTWAGNMLVPRELSFDGKTPKSCFIKELHSLFPMENTELIPKNWSVCGDGCTVTDSGFELRPLNGGTMVSCEDFPDTCLVSMDITISNPVGTVTILLGTTQEENNNSEEYLDAGYQLIIDPAEGIIRLRRHYQWNQRSDINVIPYKMAADKATHFELLLNNGILELGVNKEQTLVARLLDYQHGGFAISAQDTDADIENLHIYSM